jgi:hypothetical protein
MQEEHFKPANMWLHRQQFCVAELLAGFSYLYSYTRYGGEHI